MPVFLDTFHRLSSSCKDFRRQLLPHPQLWYYKFVVLRGVKTGFLRVMNALQPPFVLDSLLVLHLQIGLVVDSRPLVLLLVLNDISDQELVSRVLGLENLLEQFHHFILHLPACLSGTLIRYLCLRNFFVPSLALVKF
jgi:hypothetical protein